ncbi:MAG: MarR family winged helix-turn-helix transcriptional regulator [Bacillota bacterium]
MNSGIYMELFDKMIIILNRRLRGMIQAGLDPALSQPHLFFLRYLRSEGRCTVTDIANHMGITLSAITSLSNKLCDLNLASRVRSDDDRRIVYLEITGKGKDTLRVADDNVRKLFEKYFSSLAEEEVFTFFSVIQKISNQIINEEKQNKKMED